MQMGRDPAGEPIIPRHGGYRKLKSFGVARLVYDITVRFCDRYVDRRSRTHDQMVQAARSGVQNIAEGSMAAGTSRSIEMKLTNVAKASLEELRLDYEDFLRQRGLAAWPEGDPRRQELIDRRFRVADEVAEWISWIHRRERASTASTASTPSTYPELAANAALVLINVAVALLDRQVRAQAAAFERDGGFTERLLRSRRSKRQY